MAGFFEVVIYMHILIIAAAGSISGLCIAKEREALVDLKNSAYALHGVEWNISNENCCEWAGIECDASTGHVIHITLTLVSADYDDYGDSQDLCGPLPSSIANLSSLQILNLSGSCFSDFPQPSFPAFTHLTHIDFSSTRLNTLRPELGSLPSLIYLNLANTGALLGTLPPEWGNLSHLQYLDLHGVDITWNLTNWDHCTWSSLTHLDISGILFPAPLFSSLPSCLKQVIPKLQFFDMSFVGDLSPYSVLESLLMQATNVTQLFLSGMDLNPDPDPNSPTSTWAQIPGWLHLLGPQLQTFHVSECGIKGKVHPTWFRENMLQLKDFEAQNNPLMTGPLSSLVSPNMSALEHLDLSLNSLSDLGDLPSFPTTLSYISLSQNSMSGEIPVSALANSSTNLQYLDLSHNNFSGPLPFAAASKWISLTHLDLGNNHFSGGIPDSVGNMSLLSQLSLSYNELSGCIPESLGNLLSLSSTYTYGDQVGLFLNDNSLNCGIPASLGRLASLLFLDLSKNLLEGQLPTSLSNLTNLYQFDLSSNNLSGSIPDVLCNVSSESTSYAVSLSANQLVGTIPTCLVGAHIPAISVMLDISHNLLLSGHLPLSVWGGLITGTSNLNSFYLDCSHNQISGSLPASIIYNQTVSVFVDASYNNLSESLPSNIAQNCLYYGFEWYLSDNFLSGKLLPSFVNNVTCSWIESTYKKYATISLQNNLLSGTIPEALGFLSGLRYVSLSGNNFSGSIPASLANAKSLQFFDASYNKLEGKIPNWGDGTPYLWAIILRENELDGVIPPSLTNLSILTVLDVSRNRLSGSIPSFSMFTTNSSASLSPENEAIVDQSRWSALRLKQIIANHGNVNVMGSLTDVSLGSSSPEDGLGVGFFSLNVSYNMLTGPIPEGLASMSTLEWLDLSNNQLTGTIPTELRQLTSLSSFNVSYNRLEGLIPQGNQFSTFSNDSFYGNPLLCGPPLSKLCSSSDPPKENPAQQLDADSSFLSRIQKEVSLEAVGIGYAIGIVVVGYIINHYFLYSKTRTCINPS